MRQFTIFDLAAGIVVFGVAVYFFPVLLTVATWVMWIVAIPVIVLFICAMIWVRPAMLRAERRRAERRKARKEKSAEPTQ